MKYIDLFCGIGGFRVAFEESAKNRGIETECVFSSDIDEDAQQVYQLNFGERPVGDIRAVEENQIPDHDLLFAGFPCQPFSIIGGMAGFADDRGTLFFEIKRILAAKRPKAFILENVKQLKGHDGGRTFEHIRSVLANELDYWVDARVLNALDFGLPQKRERIVIVGFDRRQVAAVDGMARFDWPMGGIPMATLQSILEPTDSVPPSYFASENIRSARAKWHTPDSEPTIWHENKSGNISKLPYSCALRAGASYNYLLVDGIRRLTEREMLRLQGFPEGFKHLGYSATRKQCGNSVPVPMIQAVIDRVLDTLQGNTPLSKTATSVDEGAYSLFES
jgi:DNA (cytosine-5)-methyltransferase 1